MSQSNTTEVNIEMQANHPVTVEVTRGGIVESQHRGSLAIVDAQGNVQGQWGDIKQPVYPRSSNKALQALAMMESGAADEFGFSDAEIALACSSHGGEEIHTLGAASMLAKAGLSVDDLECGTHWPTHEETLRQMAARGEAPTDLHNNCSGKHSGMLAAALMMKVPTKGYSKRTHPLQQSILGTIEAMCGVDMSNAPVGIDGCSIPTFGIPLENLAYGFARFIAPDDLPDKRANACRRIAKAVFAHPEMVAGTSRYCTELMQIMGDRVFLKTGAEGVYTAALPAYGLGVALKCDDGATRAAEMMMTAALQHIGVFDESDMPKIERFLNVPLTNRAELVVGDIRPAQGFLNF